MKKFTFFLFSVFIILSLNIKVHAQLLKIGVGGGLTQVLGPDSYTKDVSNGGLGFSSEYNIGVIAKIGLPIIPITPRAFILYHKMNGEGSPVTILKSNNAASSNIELSQSIISAGIGAQYDIIPIPLGVNPYLSIDFTFNNFGDFSSIFNGTENITDGFSRFGLQLGVGTEVTIIPSIDVDIAASYGWFNLTGKEEGEKTISALTVDLFFTFNFL